MGSQVKSMNKEFTHHITGNSYNVVPIAIIYLITDIPFLAILIHILVENEYMRNWLHFTNVVILHFIPFVVAIVIYKSNKNNPHLVRNNILSIRIPFGYKDIEIDKNTIVSGDSKNFTKEYVKRLSVFDRPNMFIKKSGENRALGFFVDNKADFLHWYLSLTQEEK